MARALFVFVVVAGASTGGMWVEAATHNGVPPNPGAASAARMRPNSRAATPKPGTQATVRIAADPVTGAPVAPDHAGPVLSIEEMQRLARLEAEGLVTRRNPDGSETLDHEGRFEDFSVVRLGKDGRAILHCVHGRAGVELKLRHPAAATSKMEDR